MSPFSCIFTKWFEKSILEISNSWDLEIVLKFGKEFHIPK